MSRIYGESRPLDYDKVERFFAERSKKLDETGPLSVTMYQTEEIARLRDEHEKAQITPHLHIHPTTRVLDIGCGTGRWGVHLSAHVTSYLGIDFCAAYVGAGETILSDRGADPGRFRFQQLRATDVSPAALAMPPPFDLVIVAGLLAFLNDDDVRALINNLPSLSAPGATLYFREPVALNERLTLLSFPSDQLQQEYSAIYRTHAEMLTLLHRLISAGAVLESDFVLFPPAMLAAATRQETNQHVYLLRMPGGKERR